MAQSTLSVRMLAETVRTLPFSSIGATYMGIGTGLAYPSRILFTQNLTDAVLMFSFDGVNDHFALPATGFLLLDVTTNQAQTLGTYFSVGTRLYVKEIGIPSEGSVYVSTFFGGTN